MDIPIQVVGLLSGAGLATLLVVAYSLYSRRRRALEQRTRSDTPSSQLHTRLLSCEKTDRCATDEATSSASLTPAAL